MDMPCARPLGPWTVDLAVGSDHNDGSSDHPFRTVRRATCCALKCRDDGIVYFHGTLRVRCAPTCKMRACSTAQCDVRICTEHGDGLGDWNDEYGRYEFESHECAHTGCDVIFCSHCKYKLKACEYCEDEYRWGVQELGPECCYSRNHLLYCRSHLVSDRWTWGHRGHEFPERFLMCRKCEDKVEELGLFDAADQAMEGLLNY